MNDIDKSKSKKYIKIGAVVIIIIIAIGTVFLLNKNLKKNKTDFDNNATTDLTKELINEIGILNEKATEYYLSNYDNEKFISYYSYLTKISGAEATIDDVVEKTGYKLPERLKDTAIHLVKPKSLKGYNNVVINEVDKQDNLEILTVYTAVPVETGIFISSVYDKGGILTNEEYKDFVIKHSPIKGEIKNPAFDSQTYKDIIETVGGKDGNLKDGNVKHLASNDKYAVIVISDSKNPAYIKEYALQNTEGKWEIILEGLEAKEKIIVTVNTQYPDFELALLPVYNISSYGEITSDLQELIKTMKQADKIAKDEELSYSCMAGNFAYLEFKSGIKAVCYFNSGKIDVYPVEDYIAAIKKMLELEENPPVFIIKFEN